MHHPREAVIDGVPFVLIREELLEEVKQLVGDLRTSDCISLEHHKKIVSLVFKLGEL